MANFDMHPTFGEIKLRQVDLLSIKLTFGTVGQVNP